MGWEMPNVVVIAVTAVLLLVTVETVLAAIAAADSQQDVDSGADGGMKSLNIELIKSSILNKLGMQRPPEFSDRLPLQVLASKYNNDHASSTVEPSKIRHKSNRIDATGDGGTDIQGRKTATTSTDNTINSDNDGEDYHVKTQKLIAFAQPHPTVQILQDQYPLYFTFTKQTQHYRITKAILWAYKRRLDVVIDNSVVIIDVYRINPINLQHSLVSSIKRVLNTTEPGWVPIELQKNMSDWFKTINEAKNLTLMIQTYNPNRNTTHDKIPYITDARKRDDISEIPYLEVHTHHGYRNRRGASGPDRRCRRQPVTIDVDELGWDHIIVWPKTFVFYYCSGECSSTMRVHSPRPTSGREARPAAERQCCVPRKTSMLSISYLNSTGFVDYRNLSDIIVDECECKGTDSIVRSLQRFL